MIIDYKGKRIVVGNKEEALETLGISEEEYVRNARQVRYELKKDYDVEGKGYDERIKEWESKEKDTNTSSKELVESLKSNGCCICGYNKCNRALVFHHVEPDLKKFEIRVGRVRIEGLQEEVAKSLLLCLCCHAFVHYIMETKGKGEKDMKKFLEEYE
jgi:hypothetical protein